MNPTIKPSNKLIIAGQEFAIDWPLYNFRDARGEGDPGFNAYLETCSVHANGACGPGGMPREPAKGIAKLTRYRPRRTTERTLAAAQAIIKQFVIHLDGCGNAEMCFDVLQNERGLSCHFILDNDGTFYQTLDLIDCAYHAAGLNESSIGIEICNRGNTAEREPNYYNRPGSIPRDVLTCTVHGEKYVSFGFTEPQYQAMEHMTKALAKLLPGIKLDYPHDKASGDFLWTVIDPTDITSALLRQSYAGYLGHFHITNQKWDPGPFDFKRILAKAAGHRSFPIGLHSLADKTEISDEPAELKKAVEAFYDNNEQGPGGFFPVGPLEGNRLYHGGVHLHADVGSNVVAPIDGQVVAARNGPPNGSIGSTNFVLIHHSKKVGGEDVDFYSLYMHVARETPGLKKSQRIKWMASEGWDDSDPHVIVLTPPAPVQAGEVIGHVGQAGPENEPQLHFEIFAVSNDPVAKIDAKDHFWTLVSGQTDRRFCTQPPIIDPIDVGKKDKQIDDQELAEFFHSNPERELMRHMITYDYSEWSVQPNWVEALRSSGEAKFKKLKPQELQDLVEEQISPTLWWTEDIAQRLKLPLDAMVYHYHPISFLRWINEKLAVKAEASAIAKATASDHSTGKAKMDLEDKEGTSFVTEDELKVVSEAEKLRLEDLMEGYGD